MLQPPLDQGTNEAQSVAESLTVRSFWDNLSG